MKASIRELATRITKAASGTYLLVGRMGPDQAWVGRVHMNNMAGAGIKQGRDKGSFPSLEQTIAYFGRLSRAIAPSAELVGLGPPACNRSRDPRTDETQEFPQLRKQYCSTNAKNNAQLCSDCAVRTHMPCAAMRHSSTCCAAPTVYRYCSAPVILLPMHLSSAMHGLSHTGLSRDLSLRV